MGGGEPPKRSEEPAAERSGRKVLLRAVRLFVTAALILWIVRGVDWAEFWGTALHTDFLFLSLAIAITPVMALVTACKWKILLEALSFRVGFGTCFRFYLVGVFFNNVLPTHVGGDVVRGYLLGRKLRGTAGVMASVVTERVTGLMALLAAALIVIVYDRGRVFSQPVLWGNLAAVLILAVAVWLILDPGILARVRRASHRPVVEKLVRFQEAVQQYKGQREAILSCLALSLLFYLLAGVNVFLAARAFHVPLGLDQALLATPIILMIMLIPLSVGGLGLAEWAHIFILAKFDVALAAALSTALLLRVKSAGMGLVGGLAYMARSDAVGSAPLPEIEPAVTELARPAEVGSAGAG